MSTMQSKRRPEVVARNFVRFVGLQPEVERPVARELGISSAAMRVNHFAFFFLVALAALGACMRGARRGPAFFWAVPVLLTASVLVVIGTMRYRAPADAFAVVLAAAGLAELLRKAAGARDRQRSAAS